MKTIRQIADEIGVSKQAVFKKIKREPLSTSLRGLTTMVDGRLTVSVDGEKLIKQAFLHNEASTTSEMVDGRLTVVDGGCRQPVDGRLTVSVDDEEPTKQDFGNDNGFNGTHTETSSEIVTSSVLQSAVDALQAQLSVKDTQIGYLQSELEKEREHNREKDKQLLDALSKLTESQAALAASQAVQQQKELADKIIEGRQLLSDEKTMDQQGSGLASEKKKSWFSKFFR